MGLLGGSDVRGQAQEKKQHILDAGNEGDVDDLESPGRDLSAKYDPAIIFVAEAEKATTVGVVAQSVGCMSLSTS